MQVPKIDTRLVTNIWTKTSGEYFCTAKIDRTSGNRFSQEFHSRRDIDSEFLPILPLWGADLYFAPLGFVEENRSNDTVASPINLLFADLDDAPKPPRVDPSVYWRTSFGMYQAVWFLSEGIFDYEEWADLNRRLTYYLGADKGGWMGSKLLRVPRTPNFKRIDTNGVPIGELVWSKETVHNPVHLDKILPEVPNDSLRPLGPCPIVGRSSAEIKNLGEKHYRKNWYRLTLRARAMLQQKTVTDRSLHVYKTVRELVIRSKVDPIDSFYILYPQPWNKWASKPEILWGLICEAAEET